MQCNATFYLVLRVESLLIEGTEPSLISIRQMYISPRKILFTIFILFTRIEKAMGLHMHVLIYIITYVIRSKYFPIKCEYFLLI